MSTSRNLRYVVSIICWIVRILKALDCIMGNPLRLCVRLKFYINL